MRGSMQILVTGKRTVVLVVGTLMMSPLLNLVIELARYSRYICSYLHAI